MHYMYIHVHSSLVLRCYGKEIQQERSWGAVSRRCDCHDPPLQGLSSPAPPETDRHAGAPDRQNIVHCTSYGIVYNLCTYNMTVGEIYTHVHVHATSFFLSISEKCSYTHDCSCTCICFNLVF